MERSSNVKQLPLWHLLRLSVFYATYLKNKSIIKVLLNLEKFYWKYNEEIKTANKDDIVICARLCSYLTQKNIDMEHFIKMCSDCGGFLQNPSLSKMENGIFSIVKIIFYIRQYITTYLNNEIKPSYDIAINLINYTMLPDHEHLTTLISQAKSGEEDLSEDKWKYLEFPPVVPFSLLFNSRFENIDVFNLALPMIFLIMILEQRSMIQLPEHIVQHFPDTLYFPQSGLSQIENNYVSKIMSITKDMNSSIFDLEYKVLTLGINNIENIKYYHKLRTILIGEFLIMVTGPDKSGKSLLLNNIFDSNHNSNDSVSAITITNNLHIIECDPDYINKNSIFHLLLHIINCGIIILEAINANDYCSMVIIRQFYRTEIKCTVLMNKVDYLFACIYNDEEQSIWNNENENENNKLIDYDSIINKFWSRIETLTKEISNSQNFIVVKACSLKLFYNIPKNIISKYDEKSDNINAIYQDEPNKILLQRGVTAIIFKMLNECGLSNNTISTNILNRQSNWLSQMVLFKHKLIIY